MAFIIHFVNVKPGNVIKSLSLLITIITGTMKNACYYNTL